MNCGGVLAAGVTTWRIRRGGVLECVSLSDGQCLFVLCVKRSVSVSVCWAVCHLMTVFLCVCVSAWLSCCHWAPLCLCVPVVSLILWVCVSMCDSSVGKESACNAEDPVQFLGWEDLLEKE